MNWVRLMNYLVVIIIIVFTKMNYLYNCQPISNHNFIVDNYNSSTTYNMENKWRDMTNHTDSELGVDKLILKDTSALHEPVEINPMYYKCIKNVNKVVCHPLSNANEINFKYFSLNMIIMELLIFPLAAAIVLSLIVFIIYFFIVHIISDLIKNGLLYLKKRYTGNFRI